MGKKATYLYRRARRLQFAAVGWPEGPDRRPCHLPEPAAMAWEAARRAEPLGTGWAGEMAGIRCRAGAQALADRARGEAEETMAQLRAH